MFYLKKINEYLLNSSLSRFILIIPALAIIIYEVFTQFYLSSFSEHLWRNIFFWIITLSGIISYSLMMRYKIDSEKYWEILPKIKFDMGRQGTDGICCFLSYSDKGVPFPRATDQLLVRAGFTKEPDSESTMNDIINQHQIRMYAYGKRCIKLSTDYQIKDENLIFNFGCSIYDSRPQACQYYSASTCGICRLGEYCSSPVEQAIYFRWVMLFFYAFEKKKFPELASFSVGTARNFYKQYYLIPVPFQYSKDHEKIYCA